MGVAAADMPYIYIYIGGGSLQISAAPLCLPRRWSPPIFAPAVLLRYRSAAPPRRGSAVLPPCSWWSSTPCPAMVVASSPAAVLCCSSVSPLLCLLPICCPAALSMVQLSSPRPICSRCLRGASSVLCAALPPPCRPPATAHGRPLREPRGRARAGDGPRRDRGAGLEPRPGRQDRTRDEERGPKAGPEDEIGTRQRKARRKTRAGTRNAGRSRNPEAKTGRQGD